MDVVVSGKNLEITPALRQMSEEKVERIGKFASDVRRVEVEFEEIRNPRVNDGQTCEILVHLKGHLVKGHAAAAESHAALDLALDKVQRQMRKLHTRRTRRRESRRDGGPGRAARVADEVAAELEGRGADIGAEPESAADAAVIVKTKQFAVKPMDPDEAALQMDLLGHDFFLFTSAENGRAAVIYRRRDGNLGLIESTAP